MNKLRNLDAYPKINEDFYSRTLSGGLITIVSSILMLLLFFSELRNFSFFFFSSFFFMHYRFRDFIFVFFFFGAVLGLYLHAATETKLVVDTSRGETLRINVIVCSIFLIIVGNFVLHCVNCLCIVNLLC